MGSALVMVSLAVLWVVSIKTKAAGAVEVDLIHRDSPRSPFYDPSLTLYQRISNAARRSINRGRRLKRNAVGGNIVSNGGEYLLEYWVGSPRVRIMGIADTGSDLIWTQCTPCTTCYPQTAPLFDPSKSTTFALLPCDSDRCAAIPQTSCSSSCEYQVHYGDGSYTIGDVATESISLQGDAVVLPNATLGCGHSNDGTFDEAASGIVGMGGGKESLISQLGSPKFSYCLLPFDALNSSTKLKLGRDAEVSGSGTVTTPLASSTDTFYFLTLDAISVGSSKIPFSSDAPSASGNIIIDSGTTLTLLPPAFYSLLEAALVKAIHGHRRIPDPSSGLSLCYAASSPAALKPPRLTLHFLGPADLLLPPDNFFVLAADDQVCFTFAANDNLSIFGNLAQVNFLVGYDPKAGTVSFMHTNCASTTTS